MLLFFACATLRFTCRRVVVAGLGRLLDLFLPDPVGSVPLGDRVCLFVLLCTCFGIILGVVSLCDLDGCMSASE